MITKGDLLKNMSVRTGNPVDACKTGFIKYGLDPEINYPVDFFKIDFAFPDKKIGISVDSGNGKDADNRRCEYLRSKGWTVYRFMPKEIYTNKHVVGAYIYLKHFAKDDKKMRQAKNDIYLSVRHSLTDWQRDQVINDITSDKTRC